MSKSIARIEDYFVLREENGREAPGEVWFLYVPIAGNEEAVDILIDSIFGYRKCGTSEYQVAKKALHIDSILAVNIPVWKGHQHCLIKKLNLNMIKMIDWDNHEDLDEALSMGGLEVFGES